MEKRKWSLFKSRKAQFFILSVFAIVTTLYFLSRWLEPNTVIDTSSVALREESFIFNNIKEKTFDVVTSSKDCEELNFNLQEYKQVAEDYALSKNCLLDFNCNYTYSQCASGMGIKFTMKLTSTNMQLASNFSVTWPSGVPTCVPNGCNGNCPSGCTVSEDPDCGCLNGNGCCGIGCNSDNDGECPPPTCECSSGPCCDGCHYRPSSYLCRASAGPCDVAEYCTGSSADCPSDSYAADGTICDSTDYCNGNCAWYTGKRCLAGSCSQSYGGGSCPAGQKCSGGSCVVDTCGGYSSACDETGTYVTCGGACSRNSDLEYCGWCHYCKDGVCTEDGTVFPIAQDYFASNTCIDNGMFCGAVTYESSYFCDESCGGDPHMAPIKEGSCGVNVPSCAWAWMAGYDCSTDCGDGYCDSYSVTASVCCLPGYLP